MGAVYQLRIFAKSFAKVNPYLKITGTKKDGYHELDISYLSINLADRLTFAEIPEGRIEIRTKADIPTEENLCYRVARELKTSCSADSGIRITLEKNIPIGGGLGGGSSDAATTLIALNRIWNCNLARDRLIDIGKSFGADIPFFFYGGYCVGGGTGDEIRRRKSPYQNRLIPIIIPPFSQLTGEVYSEYDRMMADKPGHMRKKLINENPGRGSEYNVKNDLQEPALRIHPELSNYLELMDQANLIVTSGISGSGSSVFGITEVGVSREEVSRNLEEALGSLPGDVRLEIASPTGNGQLITEGE